MNYDLGKCSNDTVLRSEGNDVCDSERFKVQVAHIEKQPEISVCSSHIDEYDIDWKKPIKKKNLSLKWIVQNSYKKLPV